MLPSEFQFCSCALRLRALSSSPKPPHVLYNAVCARGTPTANYAIGIAIAPSEADTDKDAAAPGAVAARGAPSEAPAVEDEDATSPTAATRPATVARASGAFCGGRWWGEARALLDYIPQAQAGAGEHGGETCGARLEDKEAGLGRFARLVRSPHLLGCE